MANCATCTKSNLGMGAIRLIWLDGTWYCRPCLLQDKGLVKCALCGRMAFGNNDNFKTVDGQLTCETCMMKRNIPFSTFSVAARQPTLGASVRRVEKLLGALEDMLTKSLGRGETVLAAVNGNSGEALVVTNEHIFVLKQGLAAGSLLAKKVHPYSRSSVRSAVCSASNLYGVLVLGVAGAPEVDVRNINVAKKMQHTVTFMARDSEKFDRLVALIQERGA